MQIKQLNEQLYGTSPHQSPNASKKKGQLALKNVNTRQIPLPPQPRANNAKT